MNRHAAIDDQMLPGDIAGGGVAICIMGMVDDKLLTPAQLEVLAKQISAAEAVEKRKKRKTKGG